MNRRIARATGHLSNQTTAPSRLYGALERRNSSPGRRIAAALLGGALALAAGTALAVDDGFQLDGNALHEDQALDDWETLFDGSGSSSAYTGVIADPSPQSIFGGGNKDIQDVTQWSHKSGSVPDKSDITNAYAAAYSADNGDLVVYFGADRLANSGDMFMGFWFFKQLIRALPGGSFEGTHSEGDVLVLVNFPQAANAVPLIQVIEWDTQCTKGDSNSPAPGDCAAKNLRLRAGASGSGAVCSGAGADDFCAITNEEFDANASPGLLSDSPWPYTSKDGTSGQFPFETFFEGGINLSTVVGGDACFASFLAETRSSSSFTAQLKDFAVGDFPVCSISVEKFCVAAGENEPRLNDTEDGIIYTIQGSVTNDGFGTVYNVDVTDTPPFDADTLLFDGDPSALPGGESIGYTAKMTVPLDQNGPSDMVTATATIAADASSTSLEATAEATCPNLTINPELVVTKDCATEVVVTGSNPFVAAQVNFFGDVCNEGDTTVKNIDIVDDKADTVTPAFIASLPPATCVPYSGSYLPTSALDGNGDPTSDPAAVVFKDTVTATGTSLFGFEVSHSDMATCPLCE